jgi:predicted deacylase
MSTVYASLDALPTEPGRYQARLPITTDLSGHEVALWVNALVGARPGPTLPLLSGLHGNEWLHLLFFRELLQGIDPAQLAGRLLVVPVANAVALGTGSRAVQDDSDNNDANRAFPAGGPRQTWLADQVAAMVADEVLPRSDALLDFHLGIWGSVLASTLVGIDYSDEALVARCRRMSMVYGVPLIYEARVVRGFPGPRSSLGFAGERLKIPCCGGMLGGAGFGPELEAEWTAQNVRGVRNVLIDQGMLEGALELPERYLLYSRVQRVNPRCGGLLLPAREREQFGREVRAGEVFGQVVSPFTFEPLEQLVAPFDGYLAYWARSYPVRPGDWAFAVIPADDPETRWVDASAAQTGG